jgi:hypothetical protein
MFCRHPEYPVSRLEPVNWKSLLQNGHVWKPVRVACLQIIFFAPCTTQTYATELNEMVHGPFAHRVCVDCRSLQIHFLMSLHGGKTASTELQTV